MEELFIKLQEWIATNMPELSLVDEDYGQLENLTDENEDMYPVTFPCVLINTPSIDWNSQSEDNLSQSGLANITVRLAIDCYDDTHFTSGTASKIAGRLALFSRLHKLVATFDAPENDFYPERKATRIYSLPKGIKVYENTYNIPVLEELTL